MELISFNIPYYSEKCIDNIKETCLKGKISGDGYFSKKCTDLLKNKYNFDECHLVTSCTHALEMMAMLIEIKEGDEVIIPSYTFVSTANAFVKFGAKIICVDSKKDNPNIDPIDIEKNITSKTKAICIVHYAGWGCDMEKIVELCKKHNIILLEDAAQAIHSFYKEKLLGTFGDMSAFSFHETKNINCGEGGLLVINNKKYSERAYIIREKGTNRTQFFEKKVDKYEWIDKGSSYLLSDINAAYLYPQIENIENIIKKRETIWNTYYENLKPYEKYNVFITCEKVSNCTGNYHIFYLLFNNNEKLREIKNLLECNAIMSTTHYVPLHKSHYYIKNFGNKTLPNSEKFGDCILRLPIHNHIDINDITSVCNIIQNYLTSLKK